ncbi:MULTISPECIES: LamB/YcsF family protein [Aneurinibacillus]|uniref:5-oxoprolinase subunit A n=1 Tax=Aneurinibacillus thermoaerophilus TaxID=143495 RepID=A0A1G8CAC3_ANETH|nr:MULTISPECIES: 5-oxoprolinase subunit PxpA [Aneurinibacillus]AMA71558.1 lactam utilization protein LamB [Aneurinibacillus sp. XH2]MED0675392.1 LamB/YcsF family protein [Aneurinibacillus thermoaerophilus]MED0681186.1 LamB/YcsF family protein [Aneurinibacillus thermoaerophilus]MED0735426.1 LamB/YcsF family protein [Aneurinibacillus thermoaerophilus]MED0757324.1 LamB/YcsF family protein [Aneurinibacillus thermoaerophilus]
MYRVDINCDMGESFGVYEMGADETILSFVTSANIACGFHAGGPAVMRRTVEMALEKGVAIGAHPGLPDLEGFGRRNMDITPQEAYDMVVYQVGALYGFVKAAGGKMQHVKPHGALYNMAAKSPTLSEAIAEAVYKVDPDLILFGLSGSELVKAGERIGLRTANEVFADRTYQLDGSLTSRREPNALITDTEKAVYQVIRMVKEGKVHTVQQQDIDIQADTVCIHGDGAHAYEFAKQLHTLLGDAGVIAKAIGEV